MKKQETSIRVLEQFLPPQTFGLVAPFFQSHTIHLKLTHERKSVLGDYRNPTREKPYHRISINVNLNPYSFLITLLHELAHLLTYVHFKHTVSPHGKEWKTQFRHILIPFIGKGFFPPDVEKALMVYVHNPAASTCTDPDLYKALHRYDERKPGYRLVDDLQPGQRFVTDDGRLFEKTETLRTRSKCKEVQTGKMYYFPGIAEVKISDDKTPAHHEERKSAHHECKPGYHLVNNLQSGQRFVTDDGRLFEKTETLRTRSKCREIKTGQMYYFPGMAQVKIADV